MFYPRYSARLAASFLARYCCDSMDFFGQFISAVELINNMLCMNILYVEF